MQKASRKNQRSRAKVMFQARLSVEAERRRRRLLHAFGDCTNGALVERALLIMERECSEAEQASADAAA